MLEVVEVVGGDGAVVVERVVLLRPDEELHGYGDGAACNDKIEF